MKTIFFCITLVILIGCGPVKVQIVPSEDQLTKTRELVQNQGLVLEEIRKVLQEKKIIE